MVVEEKLRSKVLYKLLLISLKFIPVVLAVCNVVHTILCYVGLDNAADSLSMIGSCSFLTLLFLYLTSFVFRFCVYHRMPLYYIAVTNSINIYDYYIGIPIEVEQFMLLHAIILGTAMLTTIYLYVRHHKKTAAANS